MSTPSDPRSQPTKSILLINGPNLNLLGTREPHLYGSTTLQDLLTQLHTLSHSLNLTLQTFQSNHEGAIIDTIHSAAFPSPGSGNQKVDFIIINPGGLTHTSVALRDALAGVAVEFVEVHVTNIHAREEWRGKSYLSGKAVGVVCGLGVFGYEVALRFGAKRLGVGSDEKEAKL